MKPFLAFVLARRDCSHRAARRRHGGRPGSVGKRKDQRLRRLHQPALGAILRIHARAISAGSARTARPARSGSSTAPTRSTTRRIAGKNVEKANALEPRDAELEAAASAYVEAVAKLEPLLKEADDYYSQQDYKDDRMAKGKALHPRLVAAWDAFASADQKLRGGVEAINERARGGAARRDRAQRRPQDALPRRGADDPRQTRAARAGRREARHRGDHAGAE